MGIWELILILMAFSHCFLDKIYFNYNTRQYKLFTDKSALRHFSTVTKGIPL